MNHRKRLFLHFIILIAPLIFLLQASTGEIISQKKADPSTREECQYCHKGPTRHQIDHSRGPWCAACHKLHQVGFTLGLQTYFRQIGRTATNKKLQSKEEIIPQKMILIPEGEFIMGSDFSKKSLGPSHKVFLKSYYMDQYHVTNAHYWAFVKQTGHLPPPHWLRKGPGDNAAPQRPNHPISFVTWFDANAFCAWAGKRLPTEAEWEKAARGTDGRMFPWGKKYERHRTNVTQGGFKDTTPVNFFPDGKSPYGLYDMAGNLFQWTSDWFLPYPGNKVPHPNFGETLKVLRGGSFYDCTNYRCGISFQTFNRIALNPKTRAISTGFRCARSDSMSQ
ncbi:MAG: formylglycine-generating enzyme family protein [Nitrospiria bacterium]